MHFLVEKLKLKLLVYKRLCVPFNTIYAQGEGHLKIWHLVYI